MWCVIRFGICTQEQYLRLRESARYAGWWISYSLLDVGEHPTEEQVRLFEDISFTLRFSNNTFRTTFRRRFQDVDSLAMRWIGRFYPAETELHVEDRAASHALTSWEWAESLFQIFPHAVFEASDILLELIELSLPGGGKYIVEPDGTPLQYVNPPFVTTVHHLPARRYPINRLMGLRARRRFRSLALPKGWMDTSRVGECRVRRIPYIHPEALAFSRKNPRFRFRVQSVFERTPGGCHVLRTMNIFNRHYFPPDQLVEGARAAFDSLHPGGIWIVGRSLEEDFSNHATIFARREKGWEVLERIGQGSEVEDLALHAPMTG